MSTAPKVSPVDAPHLAEMQFARPINRPYKVDSLGVVNPPKALLQRGAGQFMYSPPPVRKQLDKSLLDPKEL